MAKSPAPLTLAAGWSSVLGLMLGGRRRRAVLTCAFCKKWRIMANPRTRVKDAVQGGRSGVN